MTFAAVGSIIQAGAATFTLTPAGVGDLILFEVIQVGTTSACTGMSGSNATWTQMGTAFTGSIVSNTAALFAGKVTSTSAATVTLSFSSGTATIRAAGQEFSTTTGSWAFDAQGNLDSAGTASMPSLTPSYGAGELYFAYEYDAGSAAAGSTPGYTYSADSHGNGMCFDPACASSPQAPSFGSSTCEFGIAVLVRETAGHLAGSPVPALMAAGAI